MNPEFDCRGGLQLTVIGFFLKILQAVVIEFDELDCFNSYQIMMTNFTMKRFTGSMACRNCLNTRFLHLKTS